MLTFGQMLLAVVTAILGLIVLPVILSAWAVSWAVDTYEHHSWHLRRRTRAPRLAPA